MVLKVSPRVASWFTDLVDHIAHDAIRYGDLYDVISGRNAMQVATKLNPFLELREETTTRRARAKDLTTTELGFELLISHQGRIHNAMIHLPAADHPAWEAGKLRIVVDAHGFSDSPRAHSKRSGISETAVENGAVAIALGGSRGMLKGPAIHLIRSHDGMNSALGPLSDQDGSELLQYIFEQLPAHFERYAERQGLPPIEIEFDDALVDGLSNGGALAAKLAAEGSIKHAISFSGPTSPDITQHTEADAPTNIIFVIGNNDIIVPSGGPSTPGGADFITAESAAEFFAERNGTGPLTADDLPPFLAQLQQAGVTVRSSGNETEGIVAVIDIADHGHSVPGSDPAVSESIDPVLGLESSDKISGQALLADLMAYTS